MSIVRLPDIVYPLSETNKVNEIVGALNDNLDCKYTGSNPALTAVEGVCTWDVTHNLGTEDISYTIFKDGYSVITDSEIISENVLRIMINSTENISKDEYTVFIVGGGSSRIR